MMTSDGKQRRKKRRADALITFFTVLAAMLFTLLYSLRERSRSISDPVAMTDTHTTGAWASLGAAAVAAISFSVMVFSFFYACVRLHNRHRQTRIKPLLTPAEAVTAALILVWCLSAFGLFEWFGVSAGAEKILARLMLPLIAMALFSSMTRATTSVGKRVHAGFFGVTFAHFLLQAVLVFAVPESARAARIIGGVVYASLAVALLAAHFYFARYVVAEAKRYHIVVFAGVCFVLAVAMPFVPPAVLRHFLCAYFGIILLCGTAYKARIIGHESVMLRQAEDYRYRAYHDSLTGCRNRTAYAHDVEKLENASPAPRTVGILYFDVNGLKHCNDAEGHDAGDRLIISVAQALCDVCGRTHIYRIGGDEFIGLFPDIDEKELACLVVALHNVKNENRALTRIAIGCAFGDDHPAGRIGDLQMAAEKEMYIDKRRLTAEADRTAGTGV